MSNLSNAKTNISSPKNSSIDLSHDLFTSTDFMYFKPLMVEEMLPSDSFDITINDYFRAAPMPNPVYGRIKVSKAAFFVPNRIIWKDWNTFLTGGQDGRLTRTMPQYSMSDLGDYYRSIVETGNRQQAHLVRNFYSDMGLPKEVIHSERGDDSGTVSALPFRAVKRVWWDWYRDSNLIGDEVEDSYNFKDSVSSTECPRTAEWTPINNIHPLPVPFEKDYFTTAFVEPQRGEDSYAAVVLPDSRLNPGLNTSRVTSAAVQVLGNPDDKTVHAQGSEGQGTDIIGRLKYNTLRLAHSLQHYLERNNIAGANALQQLLAHWGTAPNPAVFNRSTYINSSDSDLNIDEVTSLSETAGASLGEVTTKANGGSTFHTSFTANEHGYLIVIQILRPVTGYYQGLSRSLTRFDRFDYFTPEMECTGFQPIYSRELFYNSSRPSVNAGIFGYAPRYAEYKFHHNRVSGDYVDLPEWHMMRDFSMRAEEMPDLSIDPDITLGYDSKIYGADFSRIFGDENKDFDHFIQVSHFNFSASRPMRGYTIPVIDEIAGSDTSLPYAGVRL